ncbi:MAG: hypothetical protein AAFU79_17235 [Myxococcota bacterium]
MESHPPLFQQGFHDVEESALDNHFLDQFPTSQRRPRLIAGLRGFIAALRETGIEFELWIDGSFCTNKREPNDVDLVAIANGRDIAQLSPDRMEILTDLFEGGLARKRYDCDAYFASRDCDELLFQYRGLFAFSRDLEPKGIARLLVRP